MRKILRLLLSITFLFIIRNTNAQSGTLDIGFGNRGVVIDSSDGYLENSRTVALQNDGKIVVGSTINTPTFASIHRYNVDGSIDSAFGTNGKTVVENVSCFAISLQKDGKIIFSGSEYINRIVYIIAGRLNVSGSIDSTFGDDGIAVIKVSDYQANTYSCAIQQDGKIVITGVSSLVVNQLAYDWFALRLNTNGSVDSSFANNGILLSGFQTNSDNRCYKVLIQHDKKILITGAVHTNGSNITLARYMEDGSADPDFGVNGVVTTSLNTSAIATDCALTSDKKIVVCGSFGNTSDFVTLRYFPDGKLDSSFGTNGIASTDFQNFDDYSRAIAVQPDDKILVSGSSTSSNAAGFNLATIRLNIDGSADNSFGVNGKVITDPSSASEDVFDMALQNDGKIIVAGDAYTSTYNLCLARYNNDAVLPLSFTSFTATLQSNKVLLQWSTCNETNSKGFNIERSNDLSQWSTLAFLASKTVGKSCNNSYNYSDNTPQKGNNYYRLKHIDEDGLIQYSNIVSANILSAKIYLYPNPVKDVVHIAGIDVNAHTTIQLINSAGKMIDNKIVQASFFDYNISLLPNGIYYFLLGDGAVQQTLKFIKVK